MDDIRGKITDHTDDLELIYHQRRVWLYASGAVVAVIGITVSWFYLSSFNNNLIWWGIISISLIISVAWWYWTMSAMGNLVSAVHTEYQLLNELSVNLEHVRIIVNCKETAGNICNDCPDVDSCAAIEK